MQPSYIALVIVLPFDFEFGANNLVICKVNPENHAEKAIPKIMHE